MVQSPEHCQSDLYLLRTKRMTFSKLVVQCHNLSYTREEYQYSALSWPFVVTIHDVGQHVFYQIEIYLKNNSTSQLLIETFMLLTLIAICQIVQIIFSQYELAKWKWYTAHEFLIFIQPHVTQRSYIIQNGRKLRQNNNSRYVENGNKFTLK